jgi:hypothetical protein
MAGSNDQFKKRQCKNIAPDWLPRPREKPFFEILRFNCFRFDKAQRHQYSTFDVGCSMFDVQSFRCSDQAESNMSSAAGLESGQFDQTGSFDVVRSATKTPRHQDYSENFGSIPERDPMI